MVMMETPMNWFFLRAYADAGMLLCITLFSSLLALLFYPVLALKQPSFPMLDTEAFKELGLAMTWGAGNVTSAVGLEIGCTRKYGCPQDPCPFKGSAKKEQ